MSLPALGGSGDRGPSRIAVGILSCASRSGAPAAPVEAVFSESSIKSWRSTCALWTAGLLPSGIVVARGEVAVPCDAVRADASIAVRSVDALLTAAVAHRDILRNLCLLRSSGTMRGGGDCSDGIGSRGRSGLCHQQHLGMGIAVSDGIGSAMRTSSKGPVIQFTAPGRPAPTAGACSTRRVSWSDHSLSRPRWSERQFRGARAVARQDCRARCEPEALGPATDIAASSRAVSKWDGIAAHALKRLAIARDDIEAWRWLAFSAERRSRHQEAREAYSEILKLVARYLAATLDAAGRNRARSTPARSKPPAPRCPAARRRSSLDAAAFAQISLKNPQDVRKLLESAVAADPWNGDAQAALGTWTRDLGDYAAAASAFRMRATLQSENVAAWTDLANAYANQNRFDRALRAAEHAIKLDPTSGDAVLLKGHALVGVGRKSEGIKTLEHGLTMESKWPQWGWQWLALAYTTSSLRRGDHGARQALRIEPSFFPAPVARVDARPARSSRRGARGNRSRSQRSPSVAGCGTDALQLTCCKAGMPSNTDTKSARARRPQPFVWRARSIVSSKRSNADARRGILWLRTRSPRGGNRLS